MIEWMQSLFWGEKIELDSILTNFVLQLRHVQRLKNENFQRKRFD